jgi:cellulose synthase/poly-beta-1,6-N-acetylglucosamine synthase-like glycosyltransferase
MSTKSQPGGRQPADPAGGGDPAGDSPGGTPARWPDEPVRDATPILPERHEQAIRAFAVFTLLYTTYYIAWRWIVTINWAAWWFSIPLALAETYILVSALLLVFTAWKPRRRTPVPAPEGLSVDVFITTYDESLEIIRRTAIGASAIRYPHRTYILDDGKRDAVRELAEELGVGYMRRQGNDHAKAGNLNHALGLTDGDFILQLDADHVPLPHILDRLLGFFDDPDVAFVQSPQDFYNTDSFSYDVNEKARRLWEEQRIFFSLLQPGKDHWNAAFFCGSCGVLRRSAFEEIGGFQTETITEDMETSLVLHARGWKSVYYGESLAYGLAPASAGQYAVQRLRWGQGSMQVLRKYKPLRHKGLTWPQRISYFSSTIGYLDGPLKLVLYLAPVVFFFTGVLPIYVDERAFLVRFIPYLALNLVMFALLFRGTGFLLIAERYNMAKFWIYTLALSGFFARGKLAFNVTPKGQGDVPFRTYAPQLILAGLTVASLVFATAAYGQGWIQYDAPGWGSGAFWFNFGWAAYNLVFALHVVRLSLQYRQQRLDERFRSALPLRLEVHEGEDEDEEGPAARAGAGGESPRQWHQVPAVSVNLNPDGVGVRTTYPISPGSRTRVHLPLETRHVTATGRVVHRERRSVAGVEVFVYGVEFDDLPAADRDAIDLHCSHHEVPAQRLAYVETNEAFRKFARWLHDPRRERRRSMDLPATITAEGFDGEARLGYLVETSATGARLVVDRPVRPGARLRYDVPEADMRRSGVVASVRHMTTPMGTLYALGVRTQADTNGSASDGVEQRRTHEVGTAAA